MICHDRAQFLISGMIICSLTLELFGFRFSNYHHRIRDIQLPLENACLIKSWKLDSWWKVHEIVPNYSDWTFKCETEIVFPRMIWESQINRAYHQFFSYEFFTCFYNLLIERCRVPQFRSTFLFKGTRQFGPDFLIGTGHLGRGVSRPVPKCSRDRYSRDTSGHWILFLISEWDEIHFGMANGTGHGSFFTGHLGTLDGFWNSGRDMDTFLSPGHVPSQLWLGRNRS